jgi:hypothetical protein
MLTAICIVALTAAPDAPLAADPAVPPEPPSRKWFAVPAVVGGAGLAITLVGGLAWVIEELTYSALDQLFQTSGGARDYSVSNNILLAGLITLAVGAVGMLVVHSIRASWKPPELEPAPGPSPPPTAPPEPAGEVPAL